MKLIRLELQNFRQHVDSDIAFETGLTGIIGPNGAGKTTLVEAISFALFGSKAIRGKVEDLKTKGVKEGKLEARLTFEQSGRVYSVVRGTHDAKLYVGGEAVPVVEGTRETSTRIHTLLGMNHEEFASTFLTEQKGLEFLSGKRGATERERFIVRMLGYDKLEKVQDLLRGDRRDKRNLLTGSEAALGDREFLEKKLNDELAALTALEPEYITQLELVEKTSLEVEAAKKVYEQLELLRKDWQKGQQEVQVLQIRYQEKGKRIKEIEERLHARTENGSSTPVSELEEQKVRLEKQRQDYSWSNRKRQEIVTRKASLEKLGDKGSCPTCGQELGTSFHAALHEMESALGDVDAEITSIGTLAEIDNEITVVTSALKNAHERGMFENELVNLREDLRQLDQQIQEKGAAAKNVRFSEEEYLNKKAKYETSSRLLEVSRLQRLKLEGECKTKRALADRAKEDIRLYDERAATVEKVRREIVILDEADIVLTDFRKMLNEGIKPKLSSLASEFLAELTDGRYSTVEMAADFTPSIIDDGQTKAVISGGEADILHLSVRLALSHMLAERSGQQFSLLILDEIFGSLDENRRQNVLELFEKLGNRFEQILVITHMDDIKEGVEYLYSVDFGENGETAVVSMDTGDGQGVWWE